MWFRARYLRWTDVDLDEVDTPAAYLTTITTRLAIDRLRSAQKQREVYVGPWLPEPIVSSFAPDPAEVVTDAESLSMALLTALERLSPVEPLCCCFVRSSTSTTTR